VIRKGIKKEESLSQMPIESIDQAARPLRRGKTFGQKTSETEFR